MILKANKIFQNLKKLLDFMIEVSISNFLYWKTIKTKQESSWVKNSSTILENVNLVNLQSKEKNTQDYLLLRIRSFAVKPQRILFHFSPDAFFFKIENFRNVRLKHFYTHE